MRRVFFMVLVCCAVLPGAAQAQPQGIVRGFIWGVGMEDVRRYEKGVFFEREGDSLYFLERSEGQDLSIRYDFVQNRLWRVQIDYIDLHYPTPQAVLNVVMDRQAALSRRFGKPDGEELIWHDTLYRNHPEFFARAYGSGDVTIQAVWEEGNSLIRLESFYEGPQYRLTMVFEDRAGRQAVDQFKTFNLYDSLN